MSLTKVTYSMIQGAVVNVLDFGATGDGITNDTVAIQAAIDSISVTGGTVFFPTGEYRIARNIGTNDRWGIKVTANNITLQGTGNTSLRRYNTDISTYALAYPIVFIGTPDSNSAAATENITIEGLHFIGENVQQTTGSVIHDFREAIEAKNTVNLVVQNNIFTKIDSNVITYQKPTEYDYANNVYYNTTKNYNSKFINNTCIAEPHSTFGRAYIHAISDGGIDFLDVIGNYFEWCDVCLAGEGTYDYPGDTENSTWAPTYSGWTLGPVKRSGRGWKFNNNTVYNSSEHAIYAAGVDVEVNNNYFYTDAPNICAYEVIKIRSRDVTISGNVITNYALAIQIDVPSYNVNVTGNTIWSPESVALLEGTSVVSVQSVGLSAYYAARPWFGYADAMKTFNISNNTIQFPPTTPSSGRYQIAFRVYTDQVDANYPNGQLQGINFSNNVIQSYNIGCYFTNELFRDVCIDGNVFNAKSFTASGFDGSTVMNTYSPVVVYKGSTYALDNVQFTNNYINGCSYLFSTFTGDGTNVSLPNQINGNTLNYVKVFKSADMNTVGYNQFTNNYGLYFLDRTGWFPSVGNQLNNGTNSNSALKSLIVYTGTDVRYYNDDAGGYITLG